MNIKYLWERILHVLKNRGALRFVVVFVGWFIVHGLIYGVGVLIDSGSLMLSEADATMLALCMICSVPLGNLFLLGVLLKKRQYTMMLSILTAIVIAGVALFSI